MPLRIGAPLTIGVLALQGDVREHLHVLRAAGAQAVPVRRPDELGGIDGLVLPGGESTTIVTLARTFDLLEPLRKRISAGLPVFGSCAGMILLADRLVGGPEGQETFDGLEGGPLHAVFIRAPWVESVGPAATPLATVTAGPAAGKVVVVRQGQLLATSFHPELTGDERMHAY